MKNIILKIFKITPIILVFLEGENLLDKLVKVLLIEDNSADARFIIEMFKEISKPKYELKNVTNLQDGLKYLDKHPVDILLLDLSLPDSHGLETFEKRTQT